jgi:hypothetical protein
MAFKFETANDRWKNYKQSMDWERDDNGNAVRPSNWALGFPETPQLENLFQQMTELIQSGQHPSEILDGIENLAQQARAYTSGA